MIKRAELFVHARKTSAARRRWMDEGWVDGKGVQQEQARLGLDFSVQLVSKQRCIGVSTSRSADNK